MLFTAALCGLAAAPMWTAKSSYVTELGIMYSKLSGETKEAVINRFFGVFFLFFQSGKSFFTSQYLRIGESFLLVYRREKMGPP
jgi:hypothetical protein